LKEANAAASITAHGWDVGGPFALYIASATTHYKCFTLLEILDYVICHLSVHV
jgi:hypothetical protein